MTFENKLVAVVNKSIDNGIAMNALGHVCLGFGADRGKSALMIDNYVDAVGNEYPNISNMPFVILQANSNKIQALYRWARENGIKHGAFLNTMTGGTYIEQQQKTKASQEADLIFYAIVIEGPRELITEATRKFSLYK